MEWWSRCCKKKQVWCTLGTVLLLVAGLGLFAGSWLARYLLQEVTHQAIIDAILVDSPQSSAFQGWRENFKADDPDSPANLRQFFYFCNVTNVADVLHAGALPQIEEVGPYYYWQKRTNIDITFLEGGDKVSYNTWTRYEFLDELSNGTEGDIIYSVNPQYIGAVAIAGGELNLLIGATGPSLKLFFDVLWNEFVPDFLQQSVPDILSDAMLSLIAKAKLSNDEFLAIWANHTTGTEGIWKGMLVSANSSTGSSGMSLASANALFSFSTPFSLLDASWNSTQTWRLALHGDRVAQTNLSRRFDLTDRQLSMICTWLGGAFYDYYVYPNVSSLWGVQSITDLAYLQWGMGLLSRRSVSSLYPSANLPATPELALYWLALDKFGSLDLNTSKQLLSGPYGIFEASNVASLITGIETALKPPFDDSFLVSRWGLNIEDAATFLAYFGYMTESYTTHVLEQIFAMGGGLYTARTVRQWLWQGQDPLLNLVVPHLASKSVLVGNETTPDEARHLHNASLCWTGKQKIEDIGKYIEWKGITMLNDIYAADIPVSGVNNMGQFAPFRDLNSALYTWDDHYIRSVKLVPAYMVELKGINMIRYFVDNSTWAVNVTLNNAIAGFANLTAAFYGATVFLSNPHMLGANTSWPSMISGFPLPDPSKDGTLIDVEPNSGTIAHYDEGLEINVYLDPNSRYFDLYNTDVRRGVMVPIVWTREYGILSDSDAEAVKSNLYFAFRLQDGIFWTALAVGSVLLLLIVPALLVLLRWGQSRSALGYRPVALEDVDLGFRQETPLDDLLAPTTK